MQTCSKQNVVLRQARGIECKILYLHLDPEKKITSKEVKSGEKMQLVQIDFKELNSKQKEIFNFQIASGYLAGYGFNCIKLADDWQGADFLAYHKDGVNTLKVQLKSRFTIEKKYAGKDIYICFPIKNNWYLIEHDKLVKIVQKTGKQLESSSWKDQGGYSSAAPSKKLIESLHDYLLKPPKFEEQSISSVRL